MRIYAALAVLFIAGVVLALSFHSAPRFRTRDWEYAVPYGDSEAFFRAQEENRTLQGKLAELGLGLASLALSLAVAAGALRVRNGPTLRGLSTLSRKWVIVLLSVLTLVGLLCAEAFDLLHEIEQGEYPSWADTAAIPPAGFVFSGFVGVPIVTAGLIACLWHARLPVPLWKRPVGWWPWLATVVITLLLAVETLSLAESSSARAFPFLSTLPFSLFAHGVRG